MRPANPELHIAPQLQRGNTFRAVSRAARACHGGLGKVTPLRRLPRYKADARLARQAAEDAK